MFYLKKFNGHGEYNTFINSDECIKPNISYCIFNQHVHYNQWPPLPKIFDILYSDADGKLSYTSEVLPASDGLIPIGICIAAPSFFGDKEPARWMSLKLMNPSDPNNGSLSTSSTLNVFGNALDSLSVSSVCKNLNKQGYLYDVTTNNRQIPRLLDAYNNWNLTEFVEKNIYAITHVNGKYNSNLMLENSTQQQNWQTADTITNNNDSGYFPAACCCWRYQTLGTIQGDWYLGGCGELVMLAIYKNNINNLLSQLSQIYPNYCMASLPENIWYGTSTLQKNSVEYYLVNTTNGNVMCYGKTSPRIIALLQY